MKKLNKIHVLFDEKKYWFIWDKEKSEYFAIHSSCLKMQYQITIFIANWNLYQIFRLYCFFFWRKMAVTCQINLESLCQQSRKQQTVISSTKNIWPSELCFLIHGIETIRKYVIECSEKCHSHSKHKAKEIAVIESAQNINKVAVIQPYRRATAETFVMDLHYWIVSNFL